MGKDFCYRQRMAAKILRKILSSFITLLVLSLVVWALVRFLPADRAALIAGDTVVGPTSLVIEERGWFQWISDVIHLDLGTSTFGGEAVSTLVWQRMGAASALMISSVIVALVIALVVTAVALIRPSRFTRGIANSRYHHAPASIWDFCPQGAMSLLVRTSLDLPGAWSCLRFRWASPIQGFTSGP